MPEDRLLSFLFSWLAVEGKEDKCEGEHHHSLAREDAEVREVGEGVDEHQSVRRAEGQIGLSE
jgi:hypothetical protein